MIQVRVCLCHSCISPLRYCSDFRPYFTIHDSEFKEYTTRTQAPWVHFYFIPSRTITFPHFHSFTQSFALSFILFFFGWSDGFLLCTIASTTVCLPSLAFCLRCVQYNPICDFHKVTETQVCWLLKQTRHTSSTYVRSTKKLNNFISAKRTP